MLIFFPHPLFRTLIFLPLFYCFIWRVWAPARSISVGGVSKGGLPQLKYISPIAEWYATIQIYLTNWWTDWYATIKVYISPIDERYAAIQVYLTNWWTVCRNTSISYQLLNGLPQFKYILPIDDDMPQFKYYLPNDERYATIQVYLTNFWTVCHN